MIMTRMRIWKTWWLSYPPSLTSRSRTFCVTTGYPRSSDLPPPLIIPWPRLIGQDGLRRRLRESGRVRRLLQAVTRSTGHRNSPCPPRV